MRCANCPACCKRVRVPLTHHDLTRIVDKTSLSAEAIVEWLTPDEIDMSGEPESFVELNRGRRLLVLRHEGDGCRFLAASGYCQIYDERPASCAAYPIALERAAYPIALERGSAAERELERGSAAECVHLSLLHDAPCDRNAALARLQDLEGESEARRAVERVERELRDYVARVAEWNRQQRRRKWVRRLPQREGDFFAFLNVKTSI